VPFVLPFKSSSETIRILGEAHGKDCNARNTVQRRQRTFRDGRASVDGDLRLRRPTSTDDEHMELMRNVV
jgi:hypothetical protein